MNRLPLARALFSACLLLVAVVQLVTPPAAVQAAVIVVNADCALTDAIAAANSGTAIGGCRAGGAGRDFIVLTGDVVLDGVNNRGAHGPNGLPIITSDIVIRGGGHSIARSDAAGVPAFRLFEVAPNGRLRLEDVTLRGGLITGGRGARGANATTPGADGADGDFKAVFFIYTGGGEPGDPGGEGERGGVGDPGEAARGGAIYNAGALTIANSVLVANRVTGGTGGTGGSGTVGGMGGDGGGLGKVAPLLIPEIGGVGGRGGDGGDGGTGGTGGAAQGGAIYNASTVTLTAATLRDNAAIGGVGGRGGNGGAAGAGGDGGTDGTDIARGGDGGLGGGGGFGGHGGAAQGGALYNTEGTVDLRFVTFEGNQTQGGAAGRGGRGATGGTGGTQTGDGGLGGPGGFSGVGGAAQGGAFYHAAGTLTLDRSTLRANLALGGAGSDGGTAGSGGNGGDLFIGGLADAFTAPEEVTTTLLLAFFGVAGYETGGPGGFGGFGGDGGPAQGGAAYIAGGEVRLLSSTFHANEARLSGGGRGGAGSLGGYSSDAFVALYEWLAEQGLSDFRGLRPGPDGSIGADGSAGPAQGGALAQANGEQAIDSSTLADNRADTGGAVWQQGGTAALTASTVAYNVARDSGGVWVAGTFTAGSSILAANTGSPADARGAVQSEGYNLFGELVSAPPVDAVPTDLWDVAPALGTLTSNGGPTFTVALQALSPAIDRGRCQRSFDQRGYYRADGRCDIGAYERGASTTRPADADASATPSGTSGAAGSSATLRLPPNSYARVIALDGLFVTNPGEIGAPDVVRLNVIAAVDVFTLGPGSAAGGEVCLRGTGRVFFLGASAAPRTPVPLAAANRAGYTCAVLPADGTVVLVAGP